MLNVFSKQNSNLENFQTELAGHIKMLGGPYVARGKDVAHAWLEPTRKNESYEAKNEQKEPHKTQFINNRAFKKILRKYYKLFRALETINPGLQSVSQIWTG